MAILVLALAGLTAGSGPTEKAATAQPTVNFAGHWQGTIKDDRGARDLYLDDGVASWSRDGKGHMDSMRISLDGKGRAVVTWQGTYCLGCGFCYGSEAVEPKPWSEAYRGIYEVQGDRVVLHLGPGSPTRPEFFTPAVGAVRITLEPMKARQ